MEDKVLKKEEMEEKMKKTVVKYALKKQQEIWIVKLNVVDVSDQSLFLTAIWKNVMKIVLHVLNVMVCSQKEWEWEKL
jgi:hypothetical protein